MSNPALKAHAAPFAVANPHALATILEASQTRQIIAARDIFDISGIKLWARDQPVSGALQRKLLDRQLRNPLESCLLAADGVTPHTLVAAAQALVAGDSALAPALHPHAARLVHEAAHLPLHPVAQLLLTAAQASRPAAFDHAVAAMSLAGALMLGRNGSLGEVRLAMLAGLLHDLGEMYIDPRYGEADADRELDFTSYQQLVVHPHVGKLLLTQLTNYPASLARAVGEHHERLDGSGYPHALHRDAVSPLGRLLAVAEATLGSLRADEGTSLARASVALRVVPGEFDLALAGHVADAARDTAPAAGIAQTLDALGRLDAALRNTQQAASTLFAAAEHPALREAVALTQHLLGRLRAGWYASGLWSPQGLADDDAAEAAAVVHELGFRLRGIERAALLRGGKLPPGDAARLQGLCAALRAAA